MEGTWKHKQRYIWEEGKEKAKVFESRFRSGGEEMRGEWQIL